jgi:dual specificity phosphatase 12
VVRFVESVVAQTNLQLPPSRPLPVELVRPAPGYRTLRDELDAYRALSDEERVAATERGTMGPGKVARVAKAFARRLVSQALEQRRRDLLEQASPEKPTTNADDPEVLSKGEGGVHKFTGSDNPDRRSLEATIPALDPTLSRYACRTCRCLLFGHEHLQDPPHMPSRHKFSYRKHDISQPSSGGQCQSLFLQSVLGWMGDACEVEGRVDCPRCKLKLGSWNWAGAQCSCGTWVVPAIQIPCSRVDVVAPSATPIRQGVGLDVLPPGTVISPVILLQQHGMRSNVRDGS